MGYNRFTTIPLLRGKAWSAWLLLFACVLWPPVLDRLSAQNIPKRLQIDYRDQLLDISAQNVDIKEFFTRLAEKANITIEYPVSLDKKITVERKDVSLKRFLTNFLRNMNHVIIYSGSNMKNSRVSEVHIFPRSTAPSFSRSSATSSSGGSRDRIRRQIDNYKRIVDKLRNTISGLSENNNRRQVYLNRIKRYETRIENLEKQLY